jgi:hypothetical protein
VIKIYATWTLMKDHYSYEHIMHVHQLNGSGNYWSPSQWGKIGVPGQASSNTEQAPASINPDQVSLSDAARALQAQGGTNGSGGSTDDAGGPTGTSGTSALSPTLSPDFTQEEQLLTSLADKSLAALGIISPADEAGTQVSFDALSYDVSSSASVSLQSQQAGTAGGTSSGAQASLQFGTAQEATLTGEGHIVTADGRDFTFQIELQVGESEQGSIAAGTPLATANDAGSDSGAVSGATAPTTSDLATQLLDALLSPSASAAGNTDSTNSAAGLAANSDLGSTTNTGSATGTDLAPSTGPTINWDAILKQSKALFDLLDSLAGPSLSPSAAQAQVSPAS